MDLSLSEEQQSVVALAAQILTDKLPPARLREIENDPSGRWFADDVWNELAKADLLGICLPESVGGGGSGFLEASLLLEQQGRTVAPLPLLPTLVLGALPIARFGTAEQKKAWLPGVVDGSVVLPAAVFGGASSSVQGKLDGEYFNVPAADVAARILVPTDSGVVIVDPADEGVTVERNTALNDQPLFTLRLAGAVGEPLGDQD